MNDLLKKIQDAKTMPELDALRPAVAGAMCGKDTTEDIFDALQDAFRKSKNRLRRIPLSKRSW